MNNINKYDERRKHKNYGIAPRRNSGWGLSQGLYLIRATNGLVKIGKTQDIYVRLGSIKSNSPLEIDLILWCDAGWAEGIFHKRFRDKWSHGEWYALEDEDFLWIKTFLRIEEFQKNIDVVAKINKAAVLNSHKPLI